MQMNITAIATVTKAPVSRQVGENNSVAARFEAQVTESWLGQDNEWRSRETPLTVQVWNGLATRLMNKSPQENDKVFIEGSVDVQPYYTRDKQEFRAPIVARAGVVRILGAVEDSDYLRVCGIGNLGRDPEMRYTNSGNPVTNFSIAVNRRYTDGAGERHEETSWYGVSCFGDLAENCHTYLQRGSQAQVTGSRIEVSAWTGNDGVDRAELNIVARRVDFLGRTRTQDGDVNGGADPAAANGNGAPQSEADEDGMPW